MSKTYNFRPDSYFSIQDYDMLSDDELDLQMNGNKAQHSQKPRRTDEKNATKHRRHELSVVKRLAKNWKSFDYRPRYHFNDSSESCEDDIRIH